MKQFLHNIEKEFENFSTSEQQILIFRPYTAQEVTFKSHYQDRTVESKASNKHNGILDMKSSHVQ